MKKIVLSILFLSSLTANANLCSDSVQEQYLEQSRGTQFDYMPNISSKITILEAQEVMVIPRYRNVGPFDEVKLIFKVSGSIHSGSFGKALVVDPETCLIESAYTTYEE